MPEKLNLQYGDQDGSQRTSMTKVYFDLKLIHCLQLIVLLTVKYFDKLKMWNTNLHVLLRDQTPHQQAQQKQLSSVLTKKVHQYLLKNHKSMTQIRSLQENLKLRLCRIDWVIARSILQGRGLRFSCKDWMFKVDGLFIRMAFFYGFTGRPVIGL